MPEIRGQGVIMDKGLLKRLDAMVSAVIREDYTWPKEMDRALDYEICDKEEARFLESLGLMFVKLEAREFALEKTIEDLQSKNAKLLDAKRKNSFFSTSFVTLFLAISLYVFLTFLVKNLQWEFKDSARVVEAIFSYGLHSHHSEKRFFHFLSGRNPQGGNGIDPGHGAGNAHCLCWAYWAQSPFHRDRA
jgi:hypothetical protein